MRRQSAGTLGDPSTIFVLRWNLRGRGCDFYADADDLLNLLEAFQSIGDYKYVQIKSGLNKDNLILTDIHAILHFAMVNSHQPIRSHSFLVIEKQQEIFTHNIILSDGSGVRKIADQNSNFNSIVLAFGGDAGDRTLIMSDINTVGDTDTSVEMHKRFKKVVTSRTTRVGRKGTPHLLMPGAIAKLKYGWRLAGGKEWSRDTDPQISPEEIANL